MREMISLKIQQFRRYHDSPITERHRLFRHHSLILCLSYRCNMFLYFFQRLCIIVFATYNKGGKLCSGLQYLDILQGSCRKNPWIECFRWLNGFFVVFFPMCHVFLMKPGKNEDNLSDSVRQTLMQFDIIKTW